VQALVPIYGWPDRTAAPLVVPWPQLGNPAGFLQFQSAEEWRAFIAKNAVHAAVPHIVSAKFRRAQKLYALAWLEYDLIKAGELVALTALELALKDRYGREFGQKPRTLHALLRHMVEQDGLTDSQLPFVKRYGGSVLPYLYETDAAREMRKKTLSPAQTTLAGIRNSLAHGDPFDGLPWSGLLELVRDLIDYAYRDNDC
jgi:hypothetical protein